MGIDIDIVKKLRDETNLSITKCKEALEESEGNIDKAREILRKKGSLAADSKKDRDLGSGVVQSYIHNTNRVGSMVELLCETDFVAKNDEFIELAKNIALHIAAMKPQYRSRDDIPEDVMEQIKMELQESVDSSKQKEIQEKILKGKIDASLKEIVLLEQNYIKDETRTIKDLVDSCVQKFGERTEVGNFVVWTI